ncbi:MAG: cation transporter [Bacteroidaceae bacterium]|nr:cation transporter [Bacteroidaceae bacterium]
MSRNSEITRVTAWGAAANIALAGFKLLAGVLGRSSAMMADALHSLSDLVSDVVVLVMVRVSSKAQDRSHEYGHGKFETIATAFVAILLFVVGVKMMAGGIEKVRSAIHGGTIDSPGIISFVAALVSIAVKEILFQWTVRVGRRNDSPAVVSNAWHHRTDALSSVAAALGIGLSLLFGGRWTLLDPLVCCGISMFIFYVSAKMCLPALDELTEGSLPEEIETEIREITGSVEGVQDVHAMKTRRVGSAMIIDLHIVVSPAMSVLEAHDITVVAEKRIRERFGESTQVSIHVEPDTEAD